MYKYLKVLLLLVASKKLFDRFYDWDKKSMLYKLIFNG